MDWLTNLSKKHQPLLADARASVVVFLVALPLCLGIALASGAPASSGLIAGIIGGFVVGFLSPSQISVSGPAAGLTLVVINGLQTTGSFDLFCAITALAGVLQVISSFLKLGTLRYLIPSSVVHGMLAAIGILIVINQLPMTLGHSGSLATLTSDFAISPGVFFLTSVSFYLLLFWDQLTKRTLFNVLPATLIVVPACVLLHETILLGLGLSLKTSQLVQVPTASLFQLKSPLDVLTDFRWDYLSLILLLFLIGSIETLLNIDASEKIDPLRREVDGSRELWAQGLGNILSGLLGGLPITSVVVRSKVNVAAGAQSRRSCMLHAFWLLVLACGAPFLLNKIPLTSLASLLIFVGFKLCSPEVFKSSWRLGRSEFIPFFVTVVTILSFNLLTGVLLGFVAALAFVPKKDPRRSLSLQATDNRYVLKVHDDVSFLSKMKLRHLLAQVPPGAILEIEYAKNIKVDRDISEDLNHFVSLSSQKKIHVLPEPQKLPKIS